VIDDLVKAIETGITRVKWYNDYEIYEERVVISRLTIFLNLIEFILAESFWNEKTSKMIKHNLK